MKKFDEVKVSIKEIRDLGCQIFERAGTSHVVAKQVVNELIKNEVSGYPSHGLLRLFEYVELINTGHIIPSNSPIVKKKNKFVSEVNGQKSFGILSANYVNQSLISHLVENNFGIVTLINSGHIGRLWPIASHVCTQGGIVIGFSNLSGSGQNVLPFKGNEGRLCTNPIVIGIPSAPPIILDMATSIISEGKLRELWNKGKMAPEGWLFDKDWNTITDPTEFYKRPQTAFLGPLGGKEFGYKGFALSLMVELFAGILTGGGYSQPTSSHIANSAFFLTFHPDLLGLSLTDLQSKTTALIDHIKSSYKKDTLYIPGWETHSKFKKFNEKKTLCISPSFLEKLQKLNAT